MFSLYTGLTQNCAFLSCSVADTLFITLRLPVNLGLLCSYTLPYNDLDSCPALKDILEEMDESTELREVLCDAIMQYLEDLVDALSQHLPNKAEEKLQDIHWSRTDLLARKILVSSRHSSMRNSFTWYEMLFFFSLRKSFTEYRWLNLCRRKDDYPEFAKKAVAVLIPFLSTHLRESGFSHYTSAKTMYPSRVGAEADMRL